MRPGARRRERRRPTINHLAAASALRLAHIQARPRPTADLSTATGQTAALVRELRAIGANTARVEAVPQHGQWESQQLASAVPLARSWERQIDTVRNPLFCHATLTPPPTTADCATTRWPTSPSRPPRPTARPQPRPTSFVVASPGWCPSGTTRSGSFTGSPARRRWPARPRPSPAPPRRRSRCG